MKHLILRDVPGRGRCGRWPAAVHSTATVEGTWRADSDNYWTRSNNERWINIQLRHDGDNNGIGIPERDVPALADRRTDGPIHFTLRRDAGRSTSPAASTDGRGRGDFTFTPGRRLRVGHGPPRLPAPHRTTTCGGSRLHDITPRLRHRTSRTAGYTPDASDLIKSRIHGATPAFAQEVKAQGLGKPDIDELVKMRIHGVTPEFIKTMRDLGYKDLPIDKLVELRIHGVTPDFVKGMAALGFKDQALVGSRQVPHPRRYAGIHQVVRRSRLQEPRRRRSGQDAHSRRHDADGEGPE